MKKSVAKFKDYFWPPFCGGETFMARYHARSNVESTFSAIKRKFGDSVKTKNGASMCNKVLAKFVCHNLCCLIQSMEEFGIDPSFKVAAPLPLAL